ncbi:MAG: hypothetical protein LBB13_00840 [Rickettsiales bacterium]|nr:hypothetical protein [Rickettsiales bacterium]
MSRENSGGTIFARFSKLNFKEKAKFEKNRSYRFGGAIQAEQNTIINFNEYN